MGLKILPTCQSRARKELGLEEPQKKANVLLLWPVGVSLEGTVWEERGGKCAQDMGSLSPLWPSRAQLQSKNSLLA